MKPLELVWVFFFPTSYVETKMRIQNNSQLCIVNILHIAYFPFDFSLDCHTENFSPQVSTPSFKI